MSKIRLAIIGGGWRSEFFMRIAKEMPSTFEVCSVFMRNDEKAKVFSDKFSVKTSNSFDELVGEKPDYVIVSISQPYVLGYIEKLFQANIPVLTETPPANGVEELNKLWELIAKYSGKIQVAEQYFAWPLYASWLKVIGKGLIGESNFVNISALHGYHALSIIKRCLGITSENCRITGNQFKTKVTATDSRAGKIYTGELTEQVQDMVSLEFENGKLAFYNFSGIQYHSDIRTRHITIQGTRGEIDDMTIRYLNSDNESVMQTLNRVDYGQYNNTNWSHHGIMLGQEYLYKNPFPAARLNDDEIAIAYCMYKMKEYIETGKEFYPIKEALQDSYLSVLLYQSAKEPLKPIQTETQSWYK